MPFPVSPLDAAARLAGRRGRVVWSSEGDGPIDQMFDQMFDHAFIHTFVAAEPRATLIARGHSLVVLDATGRPTRRFTGNPLDAAEAFLAEHGCQLAPPDPLAPDPRDAPSPDPRDTGAVPRVFGYLGYDLVRVIEQLPGGPTAGHGGPDLWLAAYGAVARLSAGEIAIVGDDRDACDRLGDALAQPAPPSLPPAFGPLSADDDAAHHTARIERARDHLAAGELACVHLARRLVARITAPGDALAVHAALAEVAPARTRMLLETDSTTLVSASSERFVPAGGRGASGHAALWRAGLPPDAITGAPRLRAIALIDEIEPVRRGPYGGALGYFTAGAYELALATQVAVISHDELHVHVGGTIVADTDAATQLAALERDAGVWRSALDRLAQR